MKKFFLRLSSNKFYHKILRLNQIISILIWLGLSSLAFALDRNGNQMCDVWEARFDASLLNPSDDADGNGISNRDESIAGTNPFAKTRAFALSANRFGKGVALNVISERGKIYRLYKAQSPIGPWSAVGSPIIATNLELEFPNQLCDEAKMFYRVAVEDVDSDGDGLSDWAEEQIYGLNPNNTDSYGIGLANADRSVAENWLDSLANGMVQISSEKPDAFEKEQTAAEFIITRPPPYDRSFDVYLRRIPSSSNSVGNAESNDYTLKTITDKTVTDHLVIPAGQASVKILCRAILDTSAEVPEEVHYNISGSTLKLSSRICDAMPTAENTKLFVAYLSPRMGVNSLGSGLATVRLSGDNSSAICTLNFSNLGSVASSAHVETPNGLAILSIPPFRYNGQTWNIKATQYFTKDQQILDALLSGDFCVNVYSSMHSNGEISGTFKSVLGSTEFQEPPTVSVVATLAGEELDRDIVRFLTQATFGARWEDVVAMRARISLHSGDRIAAFEAWIDEQFTTPFPQHEPLTNAGNAFDRALNGIANLNQRNRLAAWWTLAFQSPAQLRERMTFALSQIFVVSDADPTFQRMAYSVANYYDMLQYNSFGNYRDLIKNVTLHPVMGHYLSHLRNEKSTVVNGMTVSFPDENYARELMQLFSIGLVKLHPDGGLIIGQDGLPIPNYNQEDITQLARVLTGWSFSKRMQSIHGSTAIDNNDFYASASHESNPGGRWSNPMKMFPDHHDENAKSFLGLQIPARSNGGIQDLDDTLDHLSNHQNTAPFFCRFLIQRFTSANPSPGYLYRVSTAFRQSNGNLGSTIKAILLDPEARDLSLAFSSVGSGKAKEPVIRHLSLLNAMNAHSQIPIAAYNQYGYPTTESVKFRTNATFARYQDTASALAQRPVGALSVFNFYRPDYAPAGRLSENGFVSPEFQLANETAVVKGLNFHYPSIYNSTGQVTSSLYIRNENRYLSYGDETYFSGSDNVRANYSDFIFLYMSVLDTNGDNKFSNLDTTFIPGNTTHNNAKISVAVDLLVDRVDLLLCAGSLKARYGDTVGKPRQIILDAVKSIRSGNNSDTTEISQTTSMIERIRAAFYLIAKSPDFVIQK